MAKRAANGTGIVLALLIVLVIVGLIVWFQKQARQSAAPRPHGIDLSLPKAPLPDGPKMPAPPIPIPK